MWERENGPIKRMNIKQPLNKVEPLTRRKD